MIYSSIKRLPKEPQSKLIELIRLDIMSNDSINVVWREVYGREMKTFKKIDANKVKNVDAFIDQLINIINNNCIVKNNCYSKVKLYYKWLKSKIRDGWCL